MKALVVSLIEGAGLLTSLIGISMFLNPDSSATGGTFIYAVGMLIFINAHMWGTQSNASE